MMECFGNRGKYGLIFKKEGRMRSRYCVWVLGFLLIAGAGTTAQMKERSSKRGWLGVSIQDVTERIVKKYKLPSDEGAFVANVSEDSPADSAGVREGDVIVTLGGKSVYDADDLTKLVQRTAPGTKSELVVVRDGARKTLSVTLGRQKNFMGSFAITAPHIPRMRMFVGHGMLGLEVQTLNEQLGAYFGAPNKEGVLIQSVEEESAGAKAGLQAGDVIVRIGKREVTDIDDIRKELSKRDDGDKVEIEVIRKGSRKTVTAEVEENEGPDHMFFRNHGGNMRVFPKIPGEGFEFDFESFPDEMGTELRHDLDEARRATIELKQNLNEGALKKDIRVRPTVTL
ncbi:MAG: hypothetical protein A3G43_00100 [Ignavibacteria bacterium RIFCSPLOWO2_12_FULL_56_21]|nr:MAG: hypothetical protein A2X68_06330 [Ignavibacteria bacterium GWC2_56_12]OGU76394.1 MAG: hypothetical protein A3G43_00100 [Ignavibacteria bacterium RIFCSPLOWO2_12_FULL_56_21]